VLEVRRRLALADRHEQAVGVEEIILLADLDVLIGLARMSGTLQERELRAFSIWSSPSSPGSSPSMMGHERPYDPTT